MLSKVYRKDIDFAIMEYLVLSFTLKLKEVMSGYAIVIRGKTKKLIYCITH